MVPSSAAMKELRFYFIGTCSVTAIKHLAGQKHARARGTQAKHEHKLDRHNTQRRHTPTIILRHNN